MFTAPTQLAGSPIISPPEPSVGVHVTEDAFGQVGDAPIQRYTLSNRNQVSVQVISLGAIVTSIRFPDKHGKVEDVVLGFDSPQGYLSPDNPYFGATVGRVANRIANASFSLDGKLYQLNANAGANTLHGGIVGWDKAIWEANVYHDSVTFTHISPDGDEGFPGTVTAQVTYRLTSDNRLYVDMQAISSKPTPINMVNHGYFNLAGHCGGPQGVYDTYLSVNADRHTATDENLIQTGMVENVLGTSLDLRAPRRLGDILPNFDFDVNYVINHGANKHNDMAFVARPGQNNPVNGKNGAQYTRHAAFCLETQNFPDAIHHEGRFPNMVLRPGGFYEHKMVFRFSSH